MAQTGYEIQKEAAVSPFETGSRKISGQIVEFSKFRFFLLIHSLVIGCILLYQSIWLFSNQTMAYCYAYNGEQLQSRHENPGTLVYHYMVNGEMYRETTTRNEWPLNEHYIPIRYLPYFPSFSRPDTFQSNWAGFIIGWGIFFVITAMIFFIPNETMPRNSYFYFSRKKPWINMLVR